MMTPMIDVVFLLLVYFIATTSFQRPESPLPAGVAKPPGGRAADAKPPDPLEVIPEEILLRVRQDEGGGISYQVNGSAVGGYLELVERLTRIVSVRADVPIVVAPEKRVPMQDAIAAYDAARRAGALSVYFAIRGKGKE
jgi:biopolymer transport protein ExbD